MIKLAAEKSGFTSRQDIKDILDVMEMQTISQLYVQEQVEKKIKITDDEAKAECERLRAQNPKIVSMPIDKCIMLGRGNLKRIRSQEILPKVMERIKEEVVIKHNEKFDLDAYLSANKLPALGSETPASDKQ